MSTRGEHLVRADRGFATGGGLVARLTAPAFSKVLDEIDRRLACGGIEVTVPLGEVGRAKGAFRWVNALAHRLRDNAPRKARQNIAAHYDLGNDFYSAWLDETMTYSSARFASAADSLEEAQLRKVRTLLDRLDLKPGQRLLDVGCGWGTLAIEAAKRGASVVGLTLSTEQKSWAERKASEAGLADRVEIRLQDYRDTAGPFDAVASVEMVEAVGRRWWGA